MRAARAGGRRRTGERGRGPAAARLPHASRRGSLPAAARRLGAAALLLAPLLAGACAARPRAQGPAPVVSDRISAQAPPVEALGRPPAIPNPPVLHPLPMPTRAYPRGEVYVGAAAAAGPAVGGAVGGGQVLSRTRTATWSLEMDASLQDLEATLGEDGEDTWAQVRGGLKASWLPSCRGHPTARAGLTWFRTTGDTAFVPEPGDYFGVYLGVGYEWELCPGLLTGPELGATIAAQEGTADPNVIPQVRWHLVYGF